MASIRWVRPILTTSLHSEALSARAAPRSRGAGKSTSSITVTPAIDIAVGKVSLDDWDMLT